MINLRDTNAINAMIEDSPIDMENIHHIEIKQSEETNSSLVKVWYENGNNINAIFDRNDKFVGFTYID